MSDPRVAGLDPSITETGLCAPDGVTHRCQIAAGATSGMDPDEALLRKIHTIRDWQARYTDDASLVVMEAPYVDPNRIGNVRALYFLQHALLNRFLLRRIPCIVIAPAQLKAYACGGRADKDEVHAAALDLGWAGPTHPNSQGKNNNESDAFVCYAIARHLEDGEMLGPPVDPKLAKYRRELATDLSARLRRRRAA